MSYSSAIISSQKLLENLAYLKTQNVCAMVKADAYGLGLERVCKMLFGKVNFFGVATLKEALKIRKFDKTTPVLIVGMCEDFEVASENNISVTVENYQQLKMLLSGDFLKIKIHLKINTGMNRYGIKNKKILKRIIKKIKNNKKIILEGVFTHFFCTENKKITLQQLKNFEEKIKLFKKYFKPIFHIGGGAALDVLPKKITQKYMVRVGLKLYQNVLKIESKILKTFWLKHGEYLGYSGGFVASKKTRVALVGLGYADGINRALGNKGKVEICGKPCQIIGNVCMDVFFVDVTHINCQKGFAVLVLENAENWAKICGTIEYEILTSLNFERMNVVVV